MGSELKIQIKRVGNGYLVSKNFNEQVELIRDPDPDGPEALDFVPPLLQLAAAVIEMVGRPEVSAGICFRNVVINDPNEANINQTVEWYQTVHGERFMRHWKPTLGVPKNEMKTVMMKAEDGAFWECLKCMHQWLYSGDLMHPPCPECKSKKTAPADLG